MKRLLNVLIVSIMLIPASQAFGGNLTTQNDKDKASTKIQPLPSPYSGKMEMSEDFFNFGYMPGHSVVSHIFWLKNAGSDTLEIVRIKPGCGCTKTPLNKRLLSARDSAQIEILFSSGRYRGLISKSPKVYTSDNNTPEKGLRFNGYVVYEGDTSTQILEINPFGLEIKPGEEKDKYIFRVKNLSDQTVNMKLISTNTEVFDITLPKKEIKPSRDAEITVKLLNLDYYKVPGFEKSFTIELSDPSATRYTIPIHYMSSESASTR